jgi:Putative prokaryotic signal transducing protein
MSADDLVILSTFNNQIEADLARSALESIGIESMVRADDAGGEQPGLWVGEGVQILVRERDAELARTVINESASGT